MTPIVNMDDLVAGLDAQKRAVFHKSDAPGDAAAAFASLWKAPGQPGLAATPASGAGAVPTKDTAGALLFSNPAGGDNSYLAQFIASAADVGTLILYDRLVHTSGLSGTDTASQTVNSTAITRPDANGENVEAWVECYTALGTSARTLTVTYTNQAGTGGRTGTAAIPGSTPAGRMIQVTLQSGDTGVRSIQSVQLNLSTGTAGDFGMTLLRRIATIPLLDTEVPGDADCFELGLPEIYDDACLALALYCSSASMGPVLGQITFARN